MKKRVKRKIKNVFLLATTWLACVTAFTTYWLMDLSTRVHPEIIAAFVVSVAWIVVWVAINWKWLERWYEQ